MTWPDLLFDIQSVRCASGQDLLQMNTWDLDKASNNLTCLVDRVQLLNMLGTKSCVDILLEAGFDILCKFKLKLTLNLADVNIHGKFSELRRWLKGNIRLRIGNLDIGTNGNKENFPRCGGFSERIEKCNLT